MSIFGSETKRYRVFCARCGNNFTVRELPDVLRKIIDAPCRSCREVGVDAVETDRTAGV